MEPHLPVPVETQPGQPPRYRGHCRDSVLLALTVPWELVGLSPFSPAVLWALVELNNFSPRDTLATGGTQILYVAPTVPWRLAGLGPFSARDSLGAGGTQYFHLGAWSSLMNWYWRDID